MRVPNAHDVNRPLQGRQTEAFTFVVCRNPQFTVAGNRAVRPKEMLNHMVDRMHLVNKGLHDGRALHSLRGSCPGDTDRASPVAPTERASSAAGFLQRLSCVCLLMLG